MMKGSKKLWFLVLTLCLVLISEIGNAASLFRFRDGDVSTFFRTDSASPTPNTWSVTVTVHGTETYGGKKYFHLQQYNYENDSLTQDMYIRSEGNNAYMYIVDTSTEINFLRIGPVGTTWNNPCYEDSYGLGTQYHEITAIESVTVPFGTFTNAYVVRSYEVYTGFTSPDVYNYVVPGYGMIQEVDYWADNPPQSHQLSSYVTTRPIYLRNSSTGANVLWFMNADGTRASYRTLFTDTNWTVEAAGDFNVDGVPDILLRYTPTGKVVLWFMNADGTRASYKTLLTDTNWTVVKCVDLNVDNIPDILLRYTPTGKNVLWFMNADGTRASYKTLFTDTNWTVVGGGIFNNNNVPDLVLRNTSTGQVVLWFMNADGTRASYKTLFTDTNWIVTSTDE